MHFGLLVAIREPLEIGHVGTGPALDCDGAATIFSRPKCVDEHDRLSTFRPGAVPVGRVEDGGEEETQC